MQGCAVGLKVGYARVSTGSGQQAISLEGQVRQLEAAGCDRVIAERGSAFSGKRRPGWEELNLLVAQGQVRTVVVYDQSRLSRRGEDRSFLDLCAIKGVTVEALSGGVIESESLGGFLSSGLLSVVNEAYSRQQGIKVRNGVRRRREQGCLATGRLPFGYAHVDGKAQPHPVHFQQGRAMFEQLLAGGMNINGWIRSQRAPWTNTGVRHWLHHPMLRGCVRGEWGAVQSLITSQEYEHACRLLAARSHARGRHAASVHLFTGLVQCSGCGKTLCRQRDRQTHRLKCMQPGCVYYGRSIRERIVRQQVIATLRQKARDMAALVETMPVHEPPEALALRERIAKLEALQADGLGGLDALLVAQRQNLEALLVQPSGPRYERLDALFAAEGVLELATDEELRAIVVEFVAEMRFLGNPKAVSIELR